MWLGNDYLPGFKGVGWEKAKSLHFKYENLPDKDAKVCCRDNRVWDVQISVICTYSVLSFWITLLCMYARLRRPTSMRRPTSTCLAVQLFAFGRAIKRTKRVSV